jgi:hypothetical protein
MGTSVTLGRLKHSGTAGLDVRARRKVAGSQRGASPDGKLMSASLHGTPRRKTARGVCPSSLPFYRITGLLPAVRRRKQGPSDS